MSTARKVKILGSKWDVEFKSAEEDDKLEKVDGYCDETVRRIVVTDMNSVSPDILNKEYLGYCKEQLLRHEIVHAFLLESGLGPLCEWATEEMVDWVATQFLKMIIAMKDAGALGPLYIPNYTYDYEFGG